jgi:hypothetical protein
LANIQDFAVLRSRKVLGDLDHATRALHDSASDYYLSDGVSAETSISIPSPAPQ